MMPSFVRFRERLVALVVITLTALHSTIANPIDSGEGESSITNGYGHPPMTMHMGPEMSIGPQMLMRFDPYQLQASNVQINYNQDTVQEGDSIAADETLRNEALPSENVQRRHHIHSHDADQDDYEDEDDRSLNAMLDALELLEKPSKHNLHHPHSIAVVERTLEDTPEFIEIDDSIELVTPKNIFVGSMGDDLTLMEPSSLHDADLMRRVQPASSDVANKNKNKTINQDNIKGQTDEPVDKPSFQDEAPSNLSNDEEEILVPVQDVGEQGEDVEKSDDEMTAQNSQNIAYSYSQFQPNHHLVPNHRPEENERLVDHEVPQLSFVFHPTVLRGTQPDLILHQLKSFALQLNESPIMNALFSPSTVPIPPTQPAWPSKYEAQKYLPPNLSLKRVPEGHQPQFRKSMNFEGNYLDPGALDKLEALGRLPEKSVIPFLRRSMIQVDTGELSPETVEKLNIGGRVPSRTISTIIQNSMAHNAEAFNNFMQQSFSFPQTVQVSRAFERGANEMNNFFSNQLRFPTFPSYANQFHIQNRYSQNQSPNQPFYPQLEIQTFPTPYISPSLREIVDSADDIDDGLHIVQLGVGNMNFDGQSVLQLSDDVQNEIKEAMGSKKPEMMEAKPKDDKVGNDDAPDVEDPNNTQSDVTKEVDDPAKYDMVKADAEEGIMDEVADYLMTEEPEKVLNDVNPTINPGMSDELRIDDQGKEKSIDDSLTTMSPMLDGIEVTEPNDIDQTTAINDEVKITTTLDDEISVTTEGTMNDEMTTELPQDEITTQFEIFDRINPSLVSTLAG